MDKKLRASTLIESLVAMVMVLFSMGFATLTYVSVLKSDKQLIQQRAILLLNKYAIETISKKDIIDGRIKIDNYYLEKVFEKYPYSENLYLFKLVLFDLDGNKIYSRCELIFVK